MPKLTRSFIKAAFVYLILVLVTGIDGSALGGRALEFPGFTAFILGNWGRVKPLMT